MIAVYIHKQTFRLRSRLSFSRLLLTQSLDIYYSILRASGDSEGFILTACFAALFHSILIFHSSVCYVKQLVCFPFKGTILACLSSDMCSRESLNRLFATVSLKRYILARLKTFSFIAASAQVIFRISLKYFVEILLSQHMLLLGGAETLSMSRFCPFYKTSLKLPILS